MLSVKNNFPNIYTQNQGTKDFSTQKKHTCQYFSLTHDKFIRKNQPSFGDNDKNKHRSWRMGVLATGLAAGLLSSDAKNPEYKIDDIRSSDAFRTASEKIYDDNITVLAGSRQTQEVLYSRNNYPPISNFYYTMSLIGELIKPEVRTLQQANDNFLENGIPMVYQQPVQTPDRLVDGWDKENNNAERYILLLGGQDIEENPRMNTLNLLETILVSPNVFDVPQDNIMRINSAGREDFYSGFTWLLNRVHNAENPEDVEVMVYFLGHGNQPPPNGQEDIEGSMTGELQNGLTEAELKRLANSLPDYAATTLIMDTCYSGALVAENNTDSQAKPA